MQCPKCTNDMMTSALVTQLGGEIMVAGTLATGPRPLSAQVCSACGYTELYAAQFTEDVRQAQASEAQPILEPSHEGVPAA
jgi:predicted nucleic-acid-binding Zn-ribbon protein